MEARESDHKKIKLNNGGFALVSDEDFEELSKYKWHRRSSDGYAARTIYENGKFTTVRMHREIIKAPPGLVVDHINRDRLDNRRENLRIATRSQNTANSIAPSTNKSGYKGVQYRKEQKRWRAVIRVNGKHISLGQYGTAEEAAQAYNEAAVKYFGEYARINVIAPVETAHFVEVDELSDSERGVGGFGSTGVK
ncbi:AP2 domain-containing protein [Bacillus cereus]|uniref:AP2 domain-containing protein n=1 Tax=Bacillus cereus TaxID=1396 RepID=UPI0028535823|nr:AP2 domain-containing protein [Bacillus cereus]MDR4987189.1 AP2 domain-containing protein [Bacillus cereus]